MKLREVLSTPTFRLAAYFSFTLSASMLMLFAFIFWQTAIVETKRVDHGLVRDADVIAKESPDEALKSVERRVAADFHRIVYVSLFDAEGRWVAGNLKQLPAGLRLDGQAHRTDVDIVSANQYGLQTGRVVGRRMADGRIIVIGRNVDSLEDLEDVVLRALELGVLPAALLSLLGGAILSHRTQHHIRAVHDAAERIGRGGLSERLPTRATGDHFDRLATSVNQILDNVGRMLDEVTITSDHIAHDIRTPLSRVRTQLDRAREMPLADDELRGMVDRAIAGLDQALNIIAALRRIAQIEGRERRAGFADISIEAIVREVSEFYAPVAEDKGISFVTRTNSVPSLWGDRDLLLEAIANLVDNALKYTPSGGRVCLGVEVQDGWPLVTVQDNGPGIAPGEREAVMRRFYRSDRTRHIQGCGLGLSIVEAVIRLHGFEIVIRDTNPGCSFELLCRPS